MFDQHNKLLYEADQKKTQSKNLPIEVIDLDPDLDPITNNGAPKPSVTNDTTLQKTTKTIHIIDLDNIEDSMYLFF